MADARTPQARRPTRIGCAALAAGLWLGCAGPLAHAPGGTDAEVEPSELYVMGAMVGAGFARLSLDEAEAREMARGFVDAALERPGAAEPSEQSLERARRFAQARLEAQAIDESQAVAAVLAEAAGRPGAVVRESGLVLKVIEPGEGDPPDSAQWVTVAFHGTLRDGSVFMSTRGAEPRQYPLGTTIRCWQEALSLVAPGAVLEVVCPPELAFGEQGIPPSVPGGAVLRFDLELLAVSDAP